MRKSSGNIIFLYSQQKLVIGRISILKLKKRGKKLREKAVTSILQKNHLTYMPSIFWFAQNQLFQNDLVGTSFIGKII